MKIINFLAILAISFVLISKSFAEVKSTENSARTTAIAFFEKLAQYNKTPTEKLLTDIKSQILESKIESNKKMHEVFLSEQSLESAAKSKIYETTWEESGISVCAIIIGEPEHGFIDIDPLVLIKDKDGNGWKIAGSVKNAKMTDLIADRATTLDKLIALYKIEKIAIKEKILSKQ